MWIIEGYILIEGSLSKGLDHLPSGKDGKDYTGRGEGKRQVRWGAVCVGAGIGMG